MGEMIDFLTASTDAWMLVASDGAVLAWSRGARAATGWSADEMIGRPVDELFHDPEVARSLRGAACHRGTGSGVVKIADRDGEWVRLEVRFLRLRAGDGSPDRVLACLHDAPAAPDEPSPPDPAVRVACERVAHDIRGLLAPITVAVDLLRELAPGTEDVLDTIDASVEAGTELARKLLQARAPGSARTHGGGS